MREIDFSGGHKKEIKLKAFASRNSTGSSAKAEEPAYFFRLAT